MVSLRRIGAGGLGAMAAVLTLAAAAWACVSGPAVTLSTAHAKPGQVVQLEGTNFRQPDPVTLRWNALDGPVLAQLAEPKSRSISGEFTVPADARAGNYVVIVTQAGSDGKLSQMPVRALLTVTPDGSAPPALGAPLTSAASERAEGLVVTDNSVSFATLAMVAVGVAGLGLFAAGGAALLAGRRAPARAKATAGR